MDHIQTLLQRLTGRRTVPNLLLDFHSIGGSDEVTLLHGEGGLQRQFQMMGVLPGFRANLSPNPGMNIRKVPSPDREQDPVVPPARAPPAIAVVQQLPPHAQPVAPQVDPVLPQQPPPGREEQAIGHDDIAQRHGPAGQAVERVELDREAVANRHAAEAAPADAADNKVYLARRDHHLDLPAIVKDAHERVDFIHGLGDYDKYLAFDDATDEELYVKAVPKAKRAQIPQAVGEYARTDASVERKSDEEESAQLEKLRNRLAELEALAAGRIDRVSAEDGQVVARGRRRRGGMGKVVG